VENIVVEALRDVLLGWTGWMQLPRSRSSRASYAATTGCCAASTSTS
jgi:hypothetical protein